MAVTGLELRVLKPKYDPLEEVVLGITRTGPPGSGDAGKFLLKFYRNLNANPGTDPLLSTSEAAFDASANEVFEVLNLRDEENRIAFVRTIESGKFVVRGLLNDKYYATVEVKDNAAVSAGGPGVADFEIVAISPYGFRTSYLPERLVYRARAARVDLDPLELETELDNILKNSLRDNELERALKRAQSEIEGALDTSLKVRRVITRPDLDPAFSNLYPEGVIYQAPPPGFDEVGREFSYSRTDARHFTTMHIPKLPVIEVERVRAIYLNQVFFEFPRSWEVFDKWGNVNLVPLAGTAFVQFSNAFRSFAPYQAYGADRLPGYWAVDWRYGFTGLEKDFDAILTLVGYQAAMEVLTFLGSADKPGISSESRSTGGSSEAFSFTQSAIYSLFSADVDFIGKQLPKRIDKLRQRIHGPEMFVV